MKARPDHKEASLSANGDFFRKFRNLAHQAREAVLAMGSRSYAIHGLVHGWWPTFRRTMCLMGTPQGPGLLAAEVNV